MPGNHANMSASMCVKIIWEHVHVEYAYNSNQNLNVYTDTINTQITLIFKY